MRLPAGIPGPNALADRLGVSAPTVIFGVIGVVAAAIGGWWALRPPPHPEPEVILPAAADVAIGVPAPATTTSTAPPVIKVHVAGAVARPGVHELPAHSRVVDAVAAAGGLVATADGSRLNLAEPVTDGSQVWVPAVGEDGKPQLVGVTPPLNAPGGQGSPAAGAEAAPVNVNTADAAALQALPGIGPSLAAAIVEHRERSGPFASVEELDEVPGIGPSKLEQLRSAVVV